jgi:hypothetical protein
MDPVRRALFLLLFASVLVAEPGSSRAAIGAERAEVPAATATARWIQELAVTLRRTVQPAAITVPSWHRFRPVTPPIAAVDTQVLAAHPAREPHAFRLPPPAHEG